MKFTPSDFTAVIMEGRCYLYNLWFFYVIWVYVLRKKLRVSCYPITVTQRDTTSICNIIQWIQNYIQYPRFLKFDHVPFFDPGLASNV
jgi:hypothetical protein